MIYIFSLCLDQWRFKDTVLSRLRLLRNCAMVLSALLLMALIFVFSLCLDQWRFKDTVMSKLRFLESCTMLLGALWCLYFRSVWISGDYNFEYA